MDNNFIKKLAKAHQEYDHISISHQEVGELLDNYLTLLFPQRMSGEKLGEAELQAKYESFLLSIKSSILPFCTQEEFDCGKFIKGLDQDLPDLYETLLTDAQAILDMDPATSSLNEVIIAYPGFYAIAVFRLANYFCKHDIPLFPRVLTEYAHSVTGIDIHPGATIGKSFAIDHGTGIVIGETTIIKEHVQIYQGVTLGGLVVQKELEGTKRHPTIESNVVIYANATILGGKTVVGEGSIIGGNVWLTESVPAKTKLYHQANIKIKREE